MAAEQAAAALKAAEQAAAEQAAAQAAAEKAAAEQVAALQAVAEQAAAERAAAEQAAVEQAAAEQASEQAAAEQAAAEQPRADSGANGWYDSRGWVSPDTAARALEAGLNPGEDVPGYLRCGTLCGEEPTSGEIQAQHYEEQQAAQEPPAGADGCVTIVRGECYATWEEAAAAGE